MPIESMESHSENGREVIAAALAEPAHRLLKEALGRLVAAEAMLEAMTGGIERDELCESPPAASEAA